MKYNTEEFWEEFEERAAIMEFEGKLTRKEAEEKAFADILKHCE